MVKAAVALLAVALAAFAQTYSPEKEIAIGRQLAAEVERQSKTLAPGEDVRRIAQSIERYAGLDVPLTLKLIDTRVPEVIALPGGFLFLSSGLIVRLEGEAELAGVLAHAIAHLAAHHGIRPVHTSNLASVPIIFMGTWGGVCTRLTSGKVLVPLSMKSAYARWEVEADQLALDYLRRAGYDPIPLLPIFEKLRAPLLPESRPKSVPTLHPERPPRRLGITSPPAPSPAGT